MASIPFKQKLQNIPVPLLPTLVGAATLSNMWAPLGFPLIRHLTMWICLFVLICYVGKIIIHTNTFKNEYLAPVPSSLYPGFTMFTMIFSTYLFPYIPWLGKALWLAAILLHAIHIVFFTYYHLFKHFQYDTFIPSWFVTYNGIMVATVVGVPMQEPLIGKIILYYGLAVFCVLFPCMVYRLVKHPIPDGGTYMTKAIIVAPESLCLVSYLNFSPNPHPIVVYVLYAIILIALVYDLLMMPKFLSFDFHPGFAALTFPMAIASVASNKMSGYLITINHPFVSEWVKQLSGIQLSITTGLVAYVVFNFLMVFLRSYQPIEH